jgi:flagellar hook-associated protein 2
MAALSIGGLATGIDTTTLISQLMYLERAPERILSAKKKTIQSQVDVFNQIAGALSSLKGIVAGMNTSTGFRGMKVTTGDSSVATATASSSAFPGSHTVSVTSLARFQRQVADQGYASSTDLNFKTGSIVITGGANPVTVTIAEGQNSLSGIAAAINASGANLTASVINDGSANPYRLVVTGKDTTNYTLDFSGLTGAPTAPNGAAYTEPLFSKNFSVTGDTTSGSNVISNISTANLQVGMVLSGAGLEADTVITGILGPDSVQISRNATATGTGATLSYPNSAYQAGAPASFTVDGIAVSKTSNTVTDVIPGVTLNLLKEGVTTTVGVENDDAAVTTKINSFVKSFNEAMTLLNKQSNYDATTKTAGVLSGDSTVRMVKSQLQSILTNTVSGVTGTFSMLSEIGITTNRTDGTLTVDSAKLSEALKNDFDSVVELFTRNGGVADLPANRYGVAEQFNNVLEKLTHAYEGPSSQYNGVISSRIQGLKDTMSGIDTQIESMELRLTRKEEALKKQFTALETLVSSLTTQGNSLINYLSSL